MSYHLLLYDFLWLYDGYFLESICPNILMANMIKIKQNKNVWFDFEHGYGMCDLIFYSTLSDTPAELF